MVDRKAGASAERELGSDDLRSDYVNPGPAHGAPGKGWYRLLVRPNLLERAPAYPLQYILSVYRAAAAQSAVPAVE